MISTRVKLTFQKMFATPMQHARMASAFSTALATRVMLAMERTAATLMNVRIKCVLRILNVSIRPVVTSAHVALAS